MIKYGYSDQNHDKKSNTLIFRPTGFPQKIDFNFPEGELSVCEKCKKSSKTRFQCRAHERHNSLPWNDINLCITIDSSCLDENHKMRDDTGFKAECIHPQPYLIPSGINLNCPMCVDCKEKSYSKIHCRRKNHRKLPWKTTYFLITPSEMHQNLEKLYSKKKLKTKPGTVTRCEGNELLGKIVNTHDSIPESRTFLTIISSSAQNYTVSIYVGFSSRYSNILCRLTVGS